jgi:hypothetical protein
MPGMRSGPATSLAVLLACVGAAAAAFVAVPAPRTGAATTLVAPPRSQVAQGPTVTVHRCVDAKGRVTLQDAPCPPGSRDEPRQMQRPKDPPRTRRAATPAPAVELPDFEEPLPPPPRDLIPPPPMYHCTSYDGIQRFSESYDPNPRCEPIVLYVPWPHRLTNEQALSCRWVEDSCVRLSDRAACVQWEQRRKDAVSDATRAFSDTAAYRRSELARINQIVSESCR